MHFFLEDVGSGLIRELAFGGSGLIRELAFGGSGLIRELAFGGSGFIREVAFGGSGLIREVVSIERYNLVVFYSINASKIMPDKRGVRWWEWSYKKGTTIVSGSGKHKISATE